MKTLKDCKAQKHILREYEDEFESVQDAENSFHQTNDESKRSQSEHYQQQ